MEEEGRNHLGCQESPETCFGEGINTYISYALCPRAEVHGFFT